MYVDKILAPTLALVLFCMRRAVSQTTYAYGSTYLAVLLRCCVWTASVAGFNTHTLCLTAVAVAPVFLHRLSSVFAFFSISIKS